MVAAFGVCWVINAAATVRYVDVNNSSPAPPYTNWATAATVIQDAVDVAVAGDEIVVTNGVYVTGGRALGTNMLVNRVAVDRPVTVRSVNGPQFTVIQGYQVPGTTNGNGAMRGVYLTNGAALSGFTVTNGATLDSGVWFLETSGGGIACAFTNQFVTQPALVTNCVVTGNAAFAYAGGVIFGTLLSCKITGNVSQYEAGGVWAGGLSNCTLTGNLSIFGSGGGAFGGTLSHCLVISNKASFGGGTHSSALSDCTIAGNTEGGIAGGSAIRCNISNNWAFLGGGAAGTTLSRCIVAHNSASYSGGGIKGGQVNQCLVFSNSATIGGGIYESSAVLDSVVVRNSAAENGGGTALCALYNSIVYHNVSPVNPNSSSDLLRYCCTIPLSGDELGCFTNEPAFVDLSAADFRLQSDSPCINAGSIPPFWPVTNSTDFAGGPRLVGSAADVGAFEFPNPASAVSYAWLQRYGLPTDGTADFLDLDGDGHNNWQEWQADTVPTNALSALRMLTPTRSASGVTLSWESVNTRSYWLERASNLAGQPAFSIIASNLSGQLTKTIYTDTNALGAGPFFYRVGVQP